jgi:MFS family permease
VLLHLLVDITPLRESREFRRLWVGQSLSSIGSQMTAVAVPIQVYSETHSTLAVGAIGLATAVPMLTLGLFGGSIADAVDRRRLALVTSLGLLAVSVLLAVQSGQLWALYTLVALQAGLSAVDAPARATFLPRLLPADLLPAAYALRKLSFQLTLVIAPLLAGVLIAAAGIRTAYLVDVATFGAAIYGLLRLRPMPPDGGGTSPGLRSVAEGLRYVRRNRSIAMIFLADANATVLAMPVALFPALAGGDPRVVGILYASIGIGGLLAAVLSGPLGRVRRRQRAMLTGTAIWGAAIAGAGGSPWLWLSVVLFATAGAADIVTTVMRATILQLNTPDELRGRLNGLDFVVGVGAPKLGDVRAGAVAAVTGPVLSTVTGGIACVLGAGLLALIRHDRRGASTVTGRIGC